MRRRPAPGLANDNSGNGNGSNNGSSHPRQENSLADTFMTYSAVGAGIGLGLVAAGFFARTTGLADEEQGMS
jgi:hypothetical protein